MVNAMRTDNEKLKSAKDYEILQELEDVREELGNDMYEPSWSRTKELLEYEDDLLRELIRRGIK